jgi:quinol monooxygenase YgiN
LTQIQLQQSEDSPAIEEQQSEESPAIKDQLLYPSNPYETLTQSVYGPQYHYEYQEGAEESKEEEEDASQTPSQRSVKSKSTQFSLSTQVDSEEIPTSKAVMTMIQQMQQAIQGFQQRVLIMHNDKIHLQAQVNEQKHQREKLEQQLDQMAASTMPTPGNLQLMIEQIAESKYNNLVDNKEYRDIVKGAWFRMKEHLQTRSALSREHNQKSEQAIEAWRQEMQALHATADAKRSEHGKTILNP